MVGFFSLLLLSKSPRAVCVRWNLEEENEIYEIVEENNCGRDWQMMMNTVFFSKTTLTLR